MHKRTGYWTNDDLKFLRENYMTMPMEELEQRLDRTADVIMWQASRLGLKRKNKPASHKKSVSIPWTETEFRILIKHVGKMPVKELHKKYFPYRTLAAVKSQIKRLGLTKTQAPKWSNEELELLQANFKIKSRAEIQELFPNRSMTAIDSKMTMLRLREQTPAVT